MKNEAKKKRIDKRRLLTQIFCIFLAVLMLLGVLMAVFPYVALQVYASETPEPVVSAVMTEESSETDSLLRIGMYYGSKAQKSYTVSSDTGFTVGSVSASDNRYTPFFQTASKKAIIADNTNLTVDTSGHYIYGSDNLIIGGYHLRCNTAYDTVEDITAAVNRANESLANCGLYSNIIYAYPDYTDGLFYVCIGDHSKEEYFEQKQTAIEAAVSDKTRIIYGNSVGLVVISENNRILFSYVSDTDALGLDAVEAADTAGTTEAPLILSASAQYEGVFSFPRKDGITALINILPLEKYVAGVLPYEIDPTWNEELLKAFSIIVRSYTISAGHKHAASGFDLCASADCQVYGGLGKQTETSRKAVSDTSGLVVTYNDTVCQTYYSAVAGGCTVNSEQVWGYTAIPYLRAVRTDWETYETHNKGVWAYAVSGETLYQTLKKHGYTQLKSAVSAMEILELAENSTYVYRLQITDTQGNSIEIQNTANIYAALSPYLNSANFVILQNGEQISPVSTSDGYLFRTADGITTYPASTETMEVMTADGIQTIEIENGLSVLTENGEETIAGQENRLTDAVKETIANAAAGSFVFVGKGWGHGCGFSQWGGKNLADNGASCEDIIRAYYTGVEIKSYTELT